MDEDERQRDDPLRAELNRLWADIQAAQMLLARISARLMDAEMIDRWHEHAIDAVEKRYDANDPKLAANMTRALGGLFVHLKDAEAALRPPPPPSE